MEEAKQRLAALSEQYEAELTSAKAKSEAEYAESFKKLQDKYNASKEAWLKDIVERCIHE